MSKLTHFADYVTPDDNKHRTQKALPAPEGYFPNTRDPRIRKSIKRALDFVRSEMRPGKPRQLGIKKYIIPFFGQPQTNISKWLQSILLESWDSYYSKDAGVAMSFLMRPEGVSYLMELLGETPMNEEQEVASLLKAAYGSHKEQIIELMDDTKEISYAMKSDRKFNSLQNIRSDVRKPLFAAIGFKHNYDIQACAPTLLYQLALKKGAEFLPNIEAYVGDRQALRSQLSKDTGISEETIKKILNAIFAGGKQGRSKWFSTTAMVGGDLGLAKALRDHSLIIGMKEDISAMWKILATEFIRRYGINKNGNPFTHSIKSGEKWGLYFSLEAMVQNAVSDYYTEKKIRVFLEHDGWCSKQAIDVVDLQNYIESKTGFKVKIDYEYEESPFTDLTFLDSPSGISKADRLRW